MRWSSTYDSRVVTTSGLFSDRTPVYNPRRLSAIQLYTGIREFSSESKDGGLYKALAVRQLGRVWDFHPTR